MLKTRLIDNDLAINNLIVSEDYSSDRDFYNRKLLNFSADTVVNKIVDSEIYEFLPESFSEINLNLFFLKYLQDSDINEITPYMEDEFNMHIFNTRSALSLIDSSGVTIDPLTYNIFDIKQDNGLIDKEVLSDVGKTKMAAVNSLPYFVSDKIGMAEQIRPKESGLPIFYNSFTLPYWSQRSDWLTNSMLYKNKPYFYNSFLLFEVYDTPINSTQHKLQSIPVFINKRYNISEKNITNNFIYERPCFKLSNGVEGFSFFFLNTFTQNEFYVKYSFWDALNGVQISLIPSSKRENYKKWFQNQDTFKQETRYLKYVLNYSTKKYKIYEYNIFTSSYDLERTNFDLYEFAFDKYYNNVIVKNETPISAESAILPVITIFNPLNFNIDNINTVENVPRLPIVGDGAIESQTYLGMTGVFYNKFTNIIDNINVNRFGGFNKSTLTIPVINREINGFNKEIKAFTANNIDTQNIKLRKVSLTDIVISTDFETFNSTYYNGIQSLWNDSEQYMIDESLTVIEHKADPDTIYNFTRNVFYSFDVFEVVIRRIVIDLDNGGMSTILINNWLNMFDINAELSSDEKYNALLENYNLAKASNTWMYTQVNSDLTAFFETPGIGSVTVYVIDYINSILNPLDHSGLMAEYVNLYAFQDLTMSDTQILNNLTISKLAIDIGKPVASIGYEIRDYVFDLILIQQGNGVIKPLEQFNFNLYFNIGKRLFRKFGASKEINIIGKIKLSVIDENDNIKNIYIPLNAKFNATDPETVTPYNPHNNNNPLPSL